MRTASAIAVVVLLVTGGARAQDVPLLDLIIEQLGVYLSAYEPALSAVVADEEYQQVRTLYRRGGGFIPRNGPVPVRNRRLESEVTFLRLPGGGEWYGIRDVRKVDRKPVTTTGTTLSELMKNPGVDFVERARAIVTASSLHNLDPGRTINMPTVPLEALSVNNHPRYIFRLRGRDKVAGVQTQRLEFEEFDEPTLVRSTDGGALWSRGTAWVEPESGRLWRAELIVGPDPPGAFRRRELEARVRVEFAHNAALDLLVPREMTEEFWIRGGRGQGRARYSNFRRFGTSARVIPQ
jgi:hypothetical protein